MTYKSRPCYPGGVDRAQRGRGTQTAVETLCQLSGERKGALHRPGGTLLSDSTGGRGGALGLSAPNSITVCYSSANWQTPLGVGRVARRHVGDARFRVCAASSFDDGFVHYTLYTMLCIIHCHLRYAIHYTPPSTLCRIHYSLHYAIHYTIDRSINQFMFIVPPNTCQSPGKMHAHKTKKSVS